VAGSWFRRLFAFAGPAYLVSVGYMDPGNWATDLAGGSRFGYQLIWVLLMSNLMAVLLQTLSARLGVVTGKDLAQACRDWYPALLKWPLWIMCEIAIVACDLAEVLGAAIGLHLLFGMPLLWGVLVTAADVLLLLAMSRLGMRRLEAIIVTLVATIGGCFAIEMFLSRPDIPAVLLNFIPRDGTGRPSLITHTPGGGLSVLGLKRDSLYIAMGILGATVMPHNLYLHSALVQTRAVQQSVEGKRQAARMNLIDTVVALNAAFFVNAAILVLAAAAFHTTGHQEVARLEEAHRLLAPLLGTSLASTLFAVALLSSGQSSTITGTLAGQIVLEGFLRIRIRPWLRRLLSRGLAIVPAVLFIMWRGDQGVDALLVLSQVVLSLQLSFAVIPLISFTSDRSKMGEFVNPRWVVVVAVVVAALILGLNLMLVTQQLGSWSVSLGPRAMLLWVVLGPVLAVLGGVLAYLILAPFIGRRRARGSVGSRHRGLGSRSVDSRGHAERRAGRCRSRGAAAAARSAARRQLPHHRGRARDGRRRHGGARVARIDAGATDD
jgi:manganese transport protein